MSVSTRLALPLLLLTGPLTAQSHDGYLDAGSGVKLFYHIVGAGADTLVVIHGGPGFTFDYLAPDLEPLAAHHALLFYDQRGSGKSTLVSDSAGLGADKYVADLEAVRRHFRLRQMNLLGHSWGVAVVALYAIRHPDRVRNLILVGALPATYAEFAQAFQDREAARDSVTKAAMRRWYAAREANPGDTIACRNYYHLWFIPFYSDTFAMRRTKGDICAGSAASWANKMKYVDKYALQSLGPWDWRTGIRRYQGRTLIIQGTADVFTEPTGHEWVASVADGRMVVLEHAGHFPYLEVPEHFFAAIDTFLNGSWPADARAPN